VGREVFFTDLAVRRRAVEAVMNDSADDNMDLAKANLGR